MLKNIKNCFNFKISIFIYDFNYEFYWFPTHSIFKYFDSSRNYDQQIEEMNQWKYIKIAVKLYQNRQLFNTNFLYTLTQTNCDCPLCFDSTLFNPSKTIDFFQIFVSKIITSNQFIAVTVFEKNFVEKNNSRTNIFD